MRNYKILVFTSCIGFLILFLASCKYDQIDDEPVMTGLSFQMDVVPIFNEGCNTSGCHSGVGDFAPDLSPDNAYSALIDGNYINTTIPENSLLYRWMLGEEGLPMPPDGTVNNYNQIVLQWITEGALDN